MTLRLWVALFLWALANLALGQLSFTEVTDAQALANALASPGVSVVQGSASLTRPELTGNTGTFTGGTTPGGPGPVIGIPSGVLLTTGNFSFSVRGPNNRKGSSVISDFSPDSDLQAIAGAATYDTIALTFQVIPQGPALRFEFVFGSEEYPEFVCSQYNDVFGLFVSGPGLSGPFSNSAVNAATLPNGRPISINTVNGGQVGYRANNQPVSGCDLTNTAYYVDNGDPNDPSLPDPNLYTNTQLDGFTRPLRTWVPVVPEGVYTVKVAIADVGDEEYDSALFLRALASLADFGDAPDGYGTTLLRNGPFHVLTPELYIRPTPPDWEADGQPSLQANGDANDEDTFSSLPPLTTASTSYQLTVPVTNNTGLLAVLAGWIDFNRNGQFDPGERATANVPPGATSATLTWTNLSGLQPGTTYLRLRLSTDLAFVQDPKPLGGAGDGEVEDYVLTIAGLYTLSGQVYHDRQPNGLRDPGEGWADGATVYVKLVQGGTVLQVATVSPGSGTFSFPNLASGTYTLILDDNPNPSDLTPKAPAGWHFIQPASGTRTANLTGDLGGQDFGLFRGTKLVGQVFYDDGEGGGTPNDAFRQGGERGVGGVTLTATDGTNTRTATTDGNGNYLLWIPHSWGNVTLSHPLRPATGRNNGSTPNKVTSWTEATSPASPGAVVNLGPANTLPQDLTLNFGVVRPSAFAPSQSGTARSPGTVTYSHFFRPGTQGTVALAPAQTPAFTYQARLDANCNGTWDPGEEFAPLPLSFTVGPTWPREADGSLKACALEVRVLVPAGQPDGRVDMAILEAKLTWSGNGNVVETLSLMDLTTVQAGQLSLEKKGRNCGPSGNCSGEFSTNVQGKPGEVLEYCILYRNLGTETLTQVKVTDPIPFFTDYITGSLTHNGNPAGNVTGGIVEVSVGTLTPGAGGQICYRVRIR